SPMPGADTGLGYVDGSRDGIGKQERLSLSPALLLDADIGVPGYLRILLDLRLHGAGKFFGGAANRFDAKRLQPLLNLFIADDVLYGSLKLVRDLRRCTC